MAKLYCTVDDPSVDALKVLTNIHACTYTLRAVIVLNQYMEMCTMPVCIHVYTHVAYVSFVLELSGEGQAIQQCSFRCPGSHCKSLFM